LNYKIVLNNVCDHFHSHFGQNAGVLGELPGYRQDVLNMCNWFCYFGYDVRIYANLKSADIRNTIHNLTRETVGNEKVFPKYSSLVLCILSHGESGKIFGVDGETVDIKGDLLKPLTEEVKLTNDRELLFIIQACRSRSDYPPPPVPSPSLEHYLNQNLGAESDSI